LFIGAASLLIRKTATVNGAPEKNPAAQALEALQLRRQFERGDLTEEEYRKRLRAIRAPANSKTAPLLSALDVLHRRQPPVTPSTTPPNTPEEPSPEIILTPESKRSERLLAMNCPNCGAALSVDDTAIALRCQDCHEELVVDRGHCTVTLRLKPETVTTNPVAAPDNAAEVERLEAEASRLMTVKRACGFVGLLATAGFAYEGITDISAQHQVMGSGMFAFGAALVATVVIITRHTTKTRDRLIARIRSLTTQENT
jgi:hypothetical protein